MGKICSHEKVAPLIPSGQRQINELQVNKLYKDLNLACNILDGDLSPGFEFYWDGAMTLWPNYHAFITISDGEMALIESFMVLMLQDEQYYLHENEESKIIVFNMFLKLLTKDHIRLNRVFDKLLNSNNEYLPTPNEFTMNTMFVTFAYIGRNNAIKWEYFELYLDVILFYQIKSTPHLATTIFGAVRYMPINDRSFALINDLTNNYIGDIIDLALYRRVICTFRKFGIKPTNHQIRSLKHKLCYQN